MDRRTKCRLCAECSLKLADAEIAELVGLVRRMRVHMMVGATNGLWAEYSRIMSRYEEADEKSA
ncbi:MAG: hypothetical protein E6Q97_39645 [Desulfurellales bacterium]|nr:MAG: hypothetical protein E6Q97_39645 [Desulfurellales bacterium]